MCTFLFWMEHLGYGTGAFWDLWNWFVMIRKRQRASIDIYIYMYVYIHIRINTFTKDPCFPHVFDYNLYVMLALEVAHVYKLSTIIHSCRVLVRSVNHYVVIWYYHIDTWKYGRQFIDDIFMRHFSEENVYIWLRWIRFVPKVPIDHFLTFR